MAKLLFDQWLKKVLHPTMKLGVPVPSAAEEWLNWHLAAQTLFDWGGVERLKIMELQHGLLSASGSLRLDLRNTLMINLAISEGNSLISMCSYLTK